MKAIHYNRACRNLRIGVSRCLCGATAEAPTLTFHEQEVTCRRCLRILGKYGRKEEWPNTTDATTPAL